jgi:hypothetical protein
MLTPAMAIFFEAGRMRAGSLRDEARTNPVPARRRRKRRALRQAVGTRLVSVGLRMLRGVA